jgi:hypothetical protein
VGAWWGRRSSRFLLDDCHSAQSVGARYRRGGGRVIEVGGMRRDLREEWCVNNSSLAVVAEWVANFESKVVRFHHRDTEVTEESLVSLAFSQSGFVRTILPGAALRFAPGYGEVRLWRTMCA